MRCVLCDGKVDHGTDFRIRLGTRDLLVCQKCIDKHQRRGRDALIKEIRGVLRRHFPVLFVLMGKIADISVSQRKNAGHPAPSKSKRSADKDVIDVEVVNLDETRRRKAAGRKN